MENQYYPIVLSSKDARLVEKYYDDAMACRVSIADAENLIQKLPESCNLWLHAGFDGFPQNARICQKMYEGDGSMPNSWFDYVRSLPAFDLLRDESIIQQNGRHSLTDDQSEDVRDSVFRALDDCLGFEPGLITVPQLAQGEKSERNCVNQSLATFSSEWAEDRNFEGFVYPLIFSGLRGQTEDYDWRGKVDRAIEYANIAGARHLWVVDASLDEEKAAGSYRDSRFPRLIEIHETINEKKDEEMAIIGGPYWGFNLLLWAKQLIDAPVIAVGSGFRYYLSGGIPRNPIPRAVIPPLRRLVFVDSTLARWFEQALEKLSPTEPEYSEMEAPGEDIENMSDEALNSVDEYEKQGSDEDIYSDMLSDVLDEDNIETIVSKLENLSTESRVRAVADEWRDQVAKFYKDWLSSIGEAPAEVRTLRLYQQLSKAYMLGKVLNGQIVDRPGYSGAPSAHAEQLKDFCL